MRSAFLLGALVAFVAAAPSVAAQQASASPSDVVTSESLQRRVKPGETVRVVTPDGEYRGTLTELSRTGMVLRSGTEPHVVPFGDISEVYRHHGRGVGLGAKIGTGVGLAYAWGYAEFGCPHETLPEDCQLMTATAGALMFGFLGMEVGAVTGWGIDRIHDTRPVFKARAAQSVRWFEVASTGRIALNIGGGNAAGSGQPAVAMGITVKH